MRHLIFIALLVLSACASCPDKSVTVEYACDNGEAATARYLDPSMALLSYQNRAFRLKAESVESGARYAGGGMTWATNGPKDGVLTNVDGVPVNCTMAPPKKKMGLNATLGTASQL